MWIEKIADWYFDKIPSAITDVVGMIAWLALVLPFVAAGYVSNKVVAAFMAGWVISRDHDC